METVIQAEQAPAEITEIWAWLVRYSTMISCMGSYTTREDALKFRPSVTGDVKVALVKLDLRKVVF